MLLLMSLLMSETVEARLIKEAEIETEYNEFEEDYEENLYILSHVINGEACGCSWDMKIGVGSVVINRVHDERFPDSIKDVVFQQG